MKMKTIVLAVLPSVLVGCSSLTCSRKSEPQHSTTRLDALLSSVVEDDIDSRRRAAADLCITMLKRNGVWRKEPLDWKIPTEEDIRMEVKAFRLSKQKPDLALANMCAHCMGMLKSGAWRTAPIEKADPLEQKLISILKTTDDPVVKTVILVGLASSPTAAARDAVVAATADADLGVRKSANYVVQRCSANHFGPIGVIHIGSPAGDVDASGQRIREMYKMDKTLGGRKRSEATRQRAGTEAEDRGAQP